MAALSLHAPLSNASDLCVAQRALDVGPALTSIYYTVRCDNGQRPQGYLGVATICLSLDDCQPKHDQKAHDRIKAALEKHGYVEVGGLDLPSGKGFSYLSYPRYIYERQDSKAVYCRLEESNADNCFHGVCPRTFNLALLCTDKRYDVIVVNQPEEIHDQVRTSTLSDFQVVFALPKDDDFEAFTLYKKMGASEQ